jgi:ABC-2 type transport system permease protein
VVALLVRLKLTLLRNSLRRSVWRTVGLVLGLLYALGVVVGALIGLIALRWTSTQLTGEVTVVVFSFLTLGWLLMSLLVFGVDETVDPSKFALLPVRARELVPGLFVAGLIGSPGIATVLVSLGLVATWARDVPLTVAAVVAFPLGVATCFLLARAATAAFASFLASRRFRDFAFVLLALVGGGIGIGANLLVNLAGRGGTLSLDVLTGAARILSWTPFGWAWTIPADVADGSWGAALVHLLLAAALVAALWWTWGHFLALRLVEPVDGGGGTTRVRTGTFVERLYPETPTGAVAGRTLRYWRRDPRYLAGIGGLLIAPVIVLLTQVLNPGGSLAVAAFAPTILGMLVGVSVAQDLCYDGSAVWLHVSSGLRGVADRAGRVLSALTIFGPLLVVLLAVAMAVTRQWQLLVPIVALTVGPTLVGVGVGSYVGTLWQWPMPPPGGNPFQKGNSGGLPALLSFAVTTSITLVLVLPTIALVVGSIWVGWLAYLGLLVAVVSGVVVLRLGVVLGGRRLDQRWPEVLLSVSEKAA